MIQDSETLITDVATRLALLIEEEGGVFEEAQTCFYGVISIAFEKELEIAIQRERERVFAASPAGKAENLADAKWSWYKTLMETKGDDE